MRRATRTIMHICAILILLLVVGTVQSWAQLETGSIVGVVQDKTGAVIPGASVTVTNTATSRVWKATTGSVGEYTVTGLPVGPYKVEVEHKGFKKGSVSRIFLHTSETPRVNVTLAVGAENETVNVNAQALTIDTTTSNSGGTVDQTSVENLPLNGRDFTSLIALVPGAVTTGNFGQNSVGGFETGLAGVNILLDGMDATRIDTNAVDVQLGRSQARLTRASVDSIQEFKVISGVYSAQYGRSSGAIVDVITKSGGNTLHGSAYEFFRNSAMDAKNYFSPETVPLHLNQFGGNLSGPIIKDKLFYFMNYEGIRQSIANPQTVAVMTAATKAMAVASMQPVMAAIPLPNKPGPVVFPGGIVRPDLGYYSGNLNNSLREDTGSVKIDYNASEKDTFNVRWNTGNAFTSTQYGFAAGQVSPSTQTTNLVKLGWNHIFSPTLLNQFSVGLNRPHMDSLGGGGDFPVFSCSSFWGCNPSNNFETAPGPALFSETRPEHSWEYVDTLSWIKGIHSMHIGFDIRHNVTADALYPQRFLAYDNEADFLANNALQLSTLGHNMVSVSNTNYAYFFQDDIHVTPKLTINAGLRYEYNSVLSGPQIGNFDVATLKLEPMGAPLYNPDRNDFAPRLGFSWDPWGTGKTVIRGGAGIYYSPLLTGAALSLAGNYQQSINVNIFGLLFGTTTCTPPLSLTYPLPATLPTCVPPLPAAVNALDANMRDTYSPHWSLGIQRQLARDTILEVTYVGNKGIKLPAGAAYSGLELNLSPFVFAPNRLSNNYSNIRRLGNFLNSNYNALQVSVRRHVGKGLNLDANYTWSHELDDAVNILTGAFQDSYNPMMDYASGDIDVRNNFTVGMVYDVPEASFLPKKAGSGWQVSTVIQARSGLPVNIALNAPAFGLDQIRPNLAPGVSVKPTNYSAPYNQFNHDAFTAPAYATYGNTPRNYGRGPAFYQVDLSLAKTTQLTDRLGLQFRGDMFNLFNHPNFATPDGNWNDLYFGRSTSTIGDQVGTGTSRQAQLSVKLIF